MGGGEKTLYEKNVTLKGRVSPHVEKTLPDPTIISGGDQKTHMAHKNHSRDEEWPP